MSVFKFSYDFPGLSECPESQQHGRPPEKGHESVPVPSPAAPCLTTSDITCIDAWCGGEVWRGPLPAWSPGVAPCGRSGAKHVARRRFNLQVAKRAYKRECRRAEASAAGGTWYRDRWMSCADLCSRFVSSTRAGNFSQAVACDYFGDAKVKRVSLLSWNAGGLATHTWDGLQNWLSTHGVQICCIHKRPGGLFKKIGITGLSTFSIMALAGPAA